VVKTVAERGDGVADVVGAIASHHEFVVSSGELVARRERRAAVEIESIALGMLRARLGWVRQGAALPELAAEVAAGRTDPYAAAAKLVAGFDA
jgi:LAO/AO transport system kinase